MKWLLGRSFSSYDDHGPVFINFPSSVQTGRMPGNELATRGPQIKWMTSWLRGAQGQFACGDGGGGWRVATNLFTCPLLCHWLPSIDPLYSNQRDVESSFSCVHVLHPSNPHLEMNEVRAGRLCWPVGRRNVLIIELINFSRSLTISLSRPNFTSLFVHISILWGKKPEVVVVVVVSPDHHTGDWCDCPTTHWCWPSSRFGWDGTCDPALTTTVCLEFETVMSGYPIESEGGSGAPLWKCQDHAIWRHGKRRLRRTNERAAGLRQMGPSSTQRC